MLRFSGVANPSSNMTNVDLESSFLPDKLEEMELGSEWRMLWYQRECGEMLSKFENDHSKKKQKDSEIGTVCGCNKKVDADWMVVKLLFFMG